MILSHTTANRLNASQTHAGILGKAPQVLSVMLLILGAFWMTSESNACEICELEECWFINEANVMSRDFPEGIWDHEQDGTILRDDYESSDSLILDDMLFLIDLLDAVDEETSYRRGRSRGTTGKAGSVQSDRGIVVGNPADTLLDPNADFMWGIEGALSREKKESRSRR